MAVYLVDFNLFSNKPFLSNLSDFHNMVVAIIIITNQNKSMRTNGFMG